MGTVENVWDDMFPKPLYETLMGADQKICLVCGKDKAYSTLRTIEKPILYLCRPCAADWNSYGYYILKRINPKSLMQNIIKYKVLHWFEVQSFIKCWYDLKEFRQWSEKQKKFLKKDK